jgi:hypothetical protein
MRGPWRMGVVAMELSRGSSQAELGVNEMIL